MTQPGVTTPYSSVSALLGTKASWVPDADSERIGSYNTYDAIYWNESTTYQILMRGGDTEDDVIYIPNPRTIIETINRYVGNGIGFSVLETTGSPASRVETQLAFDNLFARERFFSKYNSNKRFGLVRGDWLWHVMADPLKPEGSRISIMPVHPGNYFPVFESDVVEGGSPDKIVKVHLAEEMVEGDDIVVRRQTYEKITLNGVTTILSELSVFELDKWYVEGERAIRVISPLTVLPASITTIPVYHIKNFDEPGNPFGSSELRGFERLMAAINQSYTDEDITLALEGLGVYATDSAARPRDATTGEVTNWTVYPGRVVHNAANFRRIQGVSSVVPYGDHIERMTSALKDATGANDAATGRVDVQVAESGVALLLHLAPMLAKAVEKDQVIKDVHAQMIYDLRFWLAEFEGINIEDVTVVPTFGDKLPKNHKGLVDMVVALMATAPPVLSAASARVWLAREGMAVFADNEADLVAAEQAVVAAQADPFGARAAGELGGGDIGAEADGTGSEGGEG